MRILAIDPGTTHSGLVPIDPDWLNAFRAETRLAVRIADGMEEGSENG